MKGIDVSMHNGNIDYEKVKNSGIEVVIIKATEGVDYVDPCLERNYNNAKANELNIGFYHFMSEKTEPSRQAEDFYNAIKDKEYNVIPVLDIETNYKERSSKEVTDRCLEFLNRFKELSGIDCVIYTGGYFGRDVLDNRIKSYKAWIAHYGVLEPMHTGFKNVVGHQYTENGRISGITGNVDINTFNEGILLNSKVVVNNATTKEREYEEHGNATILVDKLNVRTGPRLTYSIVATYNKGETIYKYDRVYDREGYRWIRYVGSSGNYRYVAVRELSTNKRYVKCY